MPPPKPTRSGAAEASRTAAAELHAVGVEHCGVWLGWAAAQLESCMDNDRQANQQLLAALADVLAASQIGREPIAGAPAVAPSESMTALIIAVQGHDRVMQGITHVVQSLRALREHLGNTRNWGSAEAWRGLYEQQFHTFSMAKERARFAHMVGHEGNDRHDAASPVEAVELFTADPAGDNA